MGNARCLFCADHVNMLGVNLQTENIDIFIKANKGIGLEVYSDRLNIWSHLATKMFNFHFINLFVNI